jgi:hypothetical protein
MGQLIKRCFGDMVAPYILARRHSTP